MSLNMQTSYLGDRRTLVVLPRLASLILSSAEEGRGKSQRQEGRATVSFEIAVGWTARISSTSSMMSSRSLLQLHSHLIPIPILAPLSVSLAVMSFSSACVERLHGTCRGESAPSLRKILCGRICIPRHGGYKILETTDLG